MRKLLFLSIFTLGLTPPAAAQHRGMYGPYPMTREASGTAWQPDSSPHQSLHAMSAGWMLMGHGWVNLQWDRQDGPRGGDKVFSASMLMGNARRRLGPGTFALRAMVSLDPLMGKAGYPLLLQTGETADGSTLLVDRQHPHDFFMELAAVYTLPVGEEGSLFAYLAPVGEPALGPAVFMMRGSGLRMPLAPIGHHWMDSSHITEGVATLGGVWRDWKLEGSAFRGREPDQRRWGLEKPELDSWSGRLCWNPGPDWSLQASYGSIESPDALRPGVDVRRLTASASYNFRAGDALVQSMAAFGRNIDRPGHEHDAWLVESDLSLPSGRGLLLRGERVSKDELFAAGPLSGRAHDVHALSLGGWLDLARLGPAKLSAGLTGTAYLLPSAVRPAYGGGVPFGWFLFTRLTLG